jgi:hypothetical protein
MIVVRLEEREDHLVDRRPDKRYLFRHCRRSRDPCPQPLGDGAVVLLPALRGVVLAEIDVSAIDPDDGEVFRLVVPVLRETGWDRHDAVLSFLKRSSGSTGTTSQGLPGRTAGRQSEVLSAKRLRVRVGDGIRTRDIQIHNLVP